MALGDDLVTETQNMQRTIERRAWSTLVGAALLAVMGAIALGGLWFRVIVPPLRQMAITAQRIADGDLSVSLPEIGNRDEIGDMARAFRKMVDGLRGLFHAVSQSTHTVLEAARELESVAEQSAAGASQAAQAVSQVAAGVTEQAQASEEVRQTIEQLRRTTQEIAAGAQQTAGEIQATSQLLDRMNQVVEAVTGNAERARERAE
ncbi:MAG: methyl-accepting chemotaxis protein, partial [Bacillota bacterium]